MAIFNSTDATSKENERSDSSFRTPSMNGPVASDTVVGTSVSLEGEFTSNENIIIHGQVRGTVSTEQDLTIGESAEVHADVSAENITVSGLVEGTVRATGRLRLTATGRVKGDVSTKSLVVEEGAEITGQFSMGSDASSTKVAEVLRGQKDEKTEKKRETMAERDASAEDAIEKLVPEGI